jgi:hypothetical protein
MAIDPDHAVTFLEFVRDRHDIWRKRQAGESAPWTEDAVLASLKFTNMFRVLDPGSQFVITDLDWAGRDVSERDLLMRLFMYRYTNEPTTWKHMREELGNYPVEADLPHLFEIISRYREAGNRVFSGAYMIVPQPGHKGDKVEHVIELCRTFMHNHADEFLRAPDQQARFQALSWPFGVGNFMAMQILTDWGYARYSGQGRQEDEFVICGPGSRKGAKLVDPTAPPEQTVAWAQRALMNSVTLPWLALGPSLMDCQNMFCEYFKYDRERKRLRAGGKPKKPYAPRHPGAQPRPVVPPRW